MSRQSWCVRPAAACPYGARNAPWTLVRGIAELILWMASMVVVAEKELSQISWCQEKKSPKGRCGGEGREVTVMYSAAGLHGPSQNSLFLKTTASLG